jgi:hypothetical protein
MILKNTAGQYVSFGSLIKLSDNSRLLSGATARVNKDGTWAAAAGMLSLEETDQWSYAPTQAETNCTLLTVALDHANAIIPLIFTCRTINVTDTALLTAVNTRATQASVDQLSSDLADLDVEFSPEAIDELSAATALAVVDADVSGETVGELLTRSAGPSDVPASQRPVAEDFIAIIPKRSSGSVSASIPVRVKTSEVITAAADFTNLLAIGDRLETIVSVVTDDDDVTLTALGVDRQLAKFEVTGGAANVVYTIVVTVTTVYGATLEGQLTISYTS